MAPEESETPPPETSASSEEGDSPAPKKLPAGWQPERAGAKAHQPVFVEEPDPNFTPSPFEDKRYGAFRKQLVWISSVGILAGGTLLALFLFRPPPEQPVERPPTPAPQSTPSLSAAELRQLELDGLRGQLRAALPNRDWPEIEKRAHEILEREPNDGEAWHALGWVLEKNGAYGDAAQAYGKAIADNFLRPQALLKRASMLRLQKRYAEALPDMEESIRLDPDSVVAPNLLMIGKIQAGKTEEVRAEVQNFDRVGLVANADRYLLGKAALQLHNGDFAAAAGTLTEFRAHVGAPLFAVLVQDPYFEPYRSHPAVQASLLLPQ